LKALNKHIEGLLMCIQTWADKKYNRPGG